MNAAEVLVLMFSYDLHLRTGHRGSFDECSEIVCTEARDAMQESLSLRRDEKKYLDPQSLVL